MSYIPILDVERGIVAGFRTWRPDGGALSADDVQTALSSTSQLPANTFVCVSLEWHSLPDPAVRGELLRPSRLDGVVIDIRALQPSSPAGEAERVIHEVRDAGGLIALHASDLWRPGFSWWTRLHPAIIVLDAGWTRDLDTSPRRQIAIEAIGRLAATADAWLLGEDVRSEPDLTALIELAVPLASGSYIGAPSAQWPSLAPDAIRVARPQPRSEPGPLRAMLTAPAVSLTTSDAVVLVDHDVHTEHVVVVDEHSRPLELVTRTNDGTRQTCDILRVNVDTPVHDAAVRALARPTASRFDPITVTDNAGRLMGTVSVSRLMSSAYDGRLPAVPDVQTAWSTIVDAWL